MYASRGARSPLRDRQRRMKGACHDKPSYLHTSVSHPVCCLRWRGLRRPAAPGAHRGQGGSPRSARVFRPTDDRARRTCRTVAACSVPGHDSGDTRSTRTRGRPSRAQGRDDIRARLRSRSLQDASSPLGYELSQASCHARVQWVGRKIGRLERIRNLPAKPFNSLAHHRPSQFGFDGHPSEVILCDLIE